MISAPVISERQCAFVRLPKIRSKTARQAAKGITASRLHGAASAGRGLLILLGLRVAEVDAVSDDLSGAALVVPHLPWSCGLASGVT
jgi:hypothetical protein